MSRARDTDPPPPGVGPLGTTGATAQASRQAIDAVWRIECGRIVGALTRLTHDLGLAEECAQDALVTALERWPRDGVPDNPGAWLMTTAKHRALDQLRRHQMLDRQHDVLARELDTLEVHVVPDFVDALDAARQDTVGDDLLRLMFIACHPVLSTDARVALTLKLLGGLTTDEIARAFLVPEATLAQRIVRAKKTLAAAKVPFELPDADAMSERLGSVLEVVYLIFNEGYAATRGEHWLRPALCNEALRLARVLAGLAPAEPEVLALQALLELQASRSAARTAADGTPVLLEAQDRGRWDRLLIRRGLSVLARAAAQQAALGGEPGPYQLQAQIAACHARAARAEDTDWPAIVAVYDRLLAQRPSPVVALNRAVAVSRASGPAAALPLVDALAADARLQAYPWLHAARADLLWSLQRRDEAAAAFDRAMALTHNEPERLLLQRRRDAC